MTFAEWGAKVAEERVVLAELTLAERLTIWRSAGSGAYSTPWADETHQDTYRAAVLRSAPTHYWPLSEPSGTSVSDQGSSRQYGTHVGGVTLDIAPPLQEAAAAVTFDGTTGYATVGTSLIPATTDFSIEAWFKSPTTARQFFGQTTATDEIYLGIGGNKLIGQVLIDSVSGATASAADVHDDAWHHAVMTVARGGLVSLYLDGALVSSNTCPSGSIDLAGAWTIGALGPTPINFFDGEVSQVAIYHRAITAAEVLDHYARRVVVPQTISTYREIVAVRENGTALTERASLALVQANPGSWFFDVATQLLYVETSGSVNPSTLALVAADFVIRVGTHPKSFDAIPPYIAQISAADLPSVRFEQPEPLVGISAFPSGDLTLHNEGGFWDVPSQAWICTNRPVTFKVGGGSLAYADYATAALMQIAKPPAAGNESCVFQLRTRQNATNRAFPQSLYTDFYGAVTLDDDTLLGTYMPMLWGRVVDVPLRYLTAQSGTSNRWLLVDPVQTTEITIHSLTAIAKATGVRTNIPSGIGTAFTYFDSPTQEVLIGSDVDPELYDVVGELSRETQAHTFGTIAKDILLDCGIPSAEIDTASFTAADVAAPQTLGIWVGGVSGVETLQTGVELLNQLEKSVFGSVYLSAAGLWTCQVWDPSHDFLNLDEVDEAQILDFAPVARVTEPIVSKVVVRHTRAYFGDTWQAVSRTSDEAEALIDQVDTLTVDTLLTDAVSAGQLGDRLRLIGMRPTQEYAITLPPRFMTASPHDKLRVRRSRGPASDGVFDEVLEIQSMTKRLSDCLVEGVNGNQRGLGEAIRQVAPDSMTTWAAATDAERRAYAFAQDDTYQRTDVGDPATTQHSLVW